MLKPPVSTISKEYYESALAEFGDDPRGVNWRDAESQELRFQVLAGIGDFTGRRVHDVGCGLAHMAEWLKRENIVCEYVGSDISEKMIAAAATHAPPPAELHVADIMSGPEEPWMGADYVVNSGVFTVRSSVPESEWRVFVYDMIRAMFRVADKGIAFNLMSSYVDYRDDHLFYENPQAILDFCVAELSRKVVIRHDYPLWEYAVYVYR